MFDFYLLCALVYVTCSYSASTAMKIYLVHIGDNVKRWKLDDDALLAHKDVSSFVSSLKMYLLTEEESEEVHQVEIFSHLTSQYVALTNERLQESLAVSQPEHLLIQQNIQNVLNSAPLCILGRKFNTSNGLGIGDYIVKIKEQEKAELGTGLVSWDGSVVLAKYMEKNLNIVKGKSVLELGAGTGIAGIASWLLGAREVTLTDLPYTLDNLRANILATRQANEFSSGVGDITVHELDWTDSESYPTPNKYEVLLGADIVWLEHLVGPLVRTVAHVLGSQGIMLLAHQTRSLRTDDALFGALGGASLSYQKVSEDELAEDFRPSNIKVYVVRARRLDPL